MRSIDPPLCTLGRRDKPGVIVTVCGGDDSCRLDHSVVLDSDLELCKERMSAIIESDPVRNSDLVILEVDFVHPVRVIYDSSRFNSRIQKEKKESIFKKIKRFFFL